MESIPEAAAARTESCSAGMVRRVAAMLDLEPDEAAAGGRLARGWHFPLLAADTRRSELRSDGFPGLGAPMPALGLPRLLLGGRAVSFLRDIPIGANVSRRSVATDVTRKDAASGPMAIAKIQHHLGLSPDAEPAIVETTTYVLMAEAPRKASAPTTADTAGAEIQKTVVPDEALLFQYSALGFNSHKIHIDRAYAREVEGFPDLVVNGGLTALLMTEVLRLDLGVAPRALRIRHVAPLFCGRPMTISASRRGEGWRLTAADDEGGLAAEMEVEVQ